ncbi:hypothetical protein LTS10_012616 [Elasticomyces elasticus]|nr:hypothetical protein LTS10_012616 [Elasticomyces elasticus]
MALNVPQARTNTIKRAGSSSSIGNTIEHDNELAPVTPRSRRNSADSVNLVPSAGPASPALTRPTTQHRTDKTTIYGGKAHKAVLFDTRRLMEKSAYFNKMLSETPEPTAEQTTYEDADETSLAIYAAWIHGKKLRGPSDFHSTGHYLGLYVMAGKFGSEALMNDVIDLVRDYYTQGGLTAPPYRLQYIYTYTSEPNPMRKFLVSTAAWRSMYGGEGISDAMKEVLGDKTLAVDYMQALIVLGKDDSKDPRKGSHCSWHTHYDTKMCPFETSEPWQ